MVNSQSILGNLQTNNLLTQNIQIINDINKKFEQIKQIFKPGFYELTDTIYNGIKGESIVKSDIIITFDYIKNLLEIQIIHKVHINHPIIDPLGIIRKVYYFIKEENIIYESKTYDKYNNIIASRSGIVDLNNINDSEFSINWNGSRVVTNSVDVKNLQIIKRTNNDIITQLYDTNHKLLAEQKFIGF